MKFPISPEALLQEYGSPLFVYDANQIRTQYQRLAAGFSGIPLQIHYAMKANPNPAILKLLLEEGSCIDAVSPFEVQLAMDVGFSPEKILFTGNNIGVQELVFCVQNQVPVNIESLDALDAYGSQFPKTSVSVRINPGLGAGHHDHCITGGPKSKFGIYLDQHDEILALLKKYQLKLVGIHSHIGTGILEPEPMMEALEMVLNAAHHFDHLQFIDIGGGFGIPYQPEESTLDVSQLGPQVVTRFQEFCKNYGSELSLKIEPGRFLVGAAGTLLATVTNTKSTPRYRFVGIDSGFNHLLRPALYGSYHQIHNLSNPDNPQEPVLVAGNICETGDIFTQNSDGPQEQSLPKLQRGDLVAISDVGAYGMAMSSQYNLRPRPAEVLIEGDDIQLIRRRETYEDLMGAFQSSSA